MSSQGSPTLDLDVRARRIEGRIAIAAVVTAALSPWLLHSLDPVMLVPVCLASGALLAAGFWRAGWLGRRYRIARIAWLSDGRWLLETHAGRNSEARLDAGTRRGRSFAWLRWRSSHFLSQRHSMLLVHDDLRPGELRRLLVRLGTDRMQDPLVPAFAGADGQSRPLSAVTHTLRRLLAFSGVKPVGATPAIPGPDLPVARIRRR